jgi:hypothetical protein
MRLVLHIGLHKTASTAFQTLCRDNAGRLIDAGVHWRAHAGYPAHHEEAWSLLRGRTRGHRGLRGRGARRRGPCRDPVQRRARLRPACAAEGAAIEAEAREAGVTEVIWVAALRRPSEAFRSNISELTKHGIHVDPLQGYLEIMRSGGLHFTGRLNGGAQFWNWFFTFDYAGHVDRLARRRFGARVAYDYHAADRLPGAPILRAAARRPTR